jgi:hypothetical protein
MALGKLCSYATGARHLFFPFARKPGANPTIMSYNASVAKIYIWRVFRIKFFLRCKIVLAYYNTGVVDVNSKVVV